MNKKRNEKKSPGNGQNEFNKSMFNYLKFSLMKKHLFSFIALLALVLVGGNVMAQQGYYPSGTYEVAIGSASTFSVDDNSANSGYQWDVFELPIAHTVGATATASVVGTKVSIATPTAYSTSIRFYATPANNNLFVVQCKETETATGTCSTIRRFYVSVFDFDIQVVALGTSSSAPEDWAAAATAQSTCNTWSDNVVKNTMDAAFVATMRADSVDNATHTQAKQTNTYFAIRATINGATFNNYKLRFQWSLSTATNLNIYEIAAEDVTATGPKFAAEGGNANWVATSATSAITNPTSYVGDTYDTEQTVYLPKTAGAATEVIKVFRVATHNMLGNPDMVYTVKVDRVQLEKTDNAYNNGAKYNTNTLAASTDLARLDGTKDVSESTTIGQSPATQRISVAD